MVIARYVNSEGDLVAIEKFAGGPLKDKLALTLNEGCLGDSFKQWVLLDDGLKQWLREQLDKSEQE